MLCCPQRPTLVKMHPILFRLGGGFCVFCFDFVWIFLGGGGNCEKSTQILYFWVFKKIMIKTKTILTDRPKFSETSLEGNTAIFFFGLNSISMVLTRKIKAEYINFMCGNNKTMTAKRYTRTSRPKKEKTNYTNLPIQWGKLMLNWKTTATLFHRTEKLHKITEKITNVSRRYNSSCSWTKSKHRVESIGSLKTGNNEKCSQFKKPENTSIHSEKNLSTSIHSEKNLSTLWFQHSYLIVLQKSIRNSGSWSWLWW